MADNPRSKYTRTELMNLWASGFKDDADEIEKLAGFCDCPVVQAAEMVKSFRTTAAARKAEAAEEARKQKPPKEKKAPVPVAEEVEISEPFPATDIVAAATNSAHGFSVVEASGMSRDRKRSVIVERVSYHGEYLHRVKVTNYAHYKSKEQAIQAAKTHRLNLTVYGSSK